MRIFEGFQKGVNLGGWISQFAKYDHDHFRTFITERDIADIASLGFDHVRVPVDYNVLEDEEGNKLESGFNFHCYEPMIFTHQGAYWQEGMPLDFRIGYPKTRIHYLK